jgi:hypothetical protein
MNPHSDAHLIFTRAPKTYDEEDSLYNKCCWENWLSTYRKLKLYLCLSYCNSINSVWIKDLSMRPKTLQLVEEMQRILWKQ